MTPRQPLVAVLAPLALLAGDSLVNAQTRRPGGPSPAYRPPAAPSPRPTPAYRPTPAGSRSTLPYRSPSGYKPTPAPKPAPGYTPMPKSPATVKAPTYAKGRVSASRYAATYGVKLKSGYYAYRGLHHRHWTRRFYSRAWRCPCWYCPCTGLWYYWCGPRGLYLPVRYLPVAPPTAEEGASTELPPDAEGVQEASTAEPPTAPERGALRGAAAGLWRPGGRAPRGRRGRTPTAPLASSPD